MFGFVRKSVADELQRRLDVAAADRDHLYEMVDHEQERTVGLIRKREEALDIARDLDEGVSRLNTRIALIELLARDDVSYFVVAVHNENVYTGAEVADPFDGLDIGEGISNLLERLTEEIASDYGIDLDAIREEIDRDANRPEVVQNFYGYADGGRV